MFTVLLHHKTDYINVRLFYWMILTLFIFRCDDVTVGVSLSDKLMSHLSHHPIPDIVDLLSMLAIGYQVQVIGELDIFGDFL